MKMKMLSFYSVGLRSQSIGKVNIHTWFIERCGDIVACHWKERLSAQNYKVQPAGKANHTATWKPLTTICLRAISLIATELQVDQRLKNPAKYVCHFIIFIFLFFLFSVVCCSRDEGNTHITHANLIRTSLRARLLEGIALFKVAHLCSNIQYDAFWKGGFILKG